MKMKGLNKSGIPLYIQLEQIIKSQVVTGELVPGQKIPAEKEIAKQYKVSIITVRQAILDLVREGLIVRRQGKGTFVTETGRTVKNIMTLNAQGGLEEVIPEGLLKQKVEVLDIAMIEGPKYVARCLGLEEGAPLYCVLRRRSENGVYLSYVKNYLPAEIGKNITSADLAKYPMLYVLKNKLGIQLSQGTQYIEAIVADYEIANALSIEISSPILYLEMVIVDKANRPVDFVQTFYRADLFRYTLKFDLKGIGTTA